MKRKSRLGKNDFISGRNSYGVWIRTRRKDARSALIVGACILGCLSILLLAGIAFGGGH